MRRGALDVFTNYTTKNADFKPKRRQNTWERYKILTKGRAIDKNE